MCSPLPVPSHYMLTVSPYEDATFGKPCFHMYICNKSYIFLHLYLCFLLVSMTPFVGHFLTFLWNQWRHSTRASSFVYLCASVLVWLFFSAKKSDSDKINLVISENSIITILESNYCRGVGVLLIVFCLPVCLSFCLYLQKICIHIIMVLCYVHLILVLPGVSVVKRS